MTVIQLSNWQGRRWLAHQRKMGHWELTATDHGDYPCEVFEGHGGHWVFVVGMRTFGHCESLEEAKRLCREDIKRLKKGLESLHPNPFPY